jgi:hypothetical protein
MAEVLVLEFNHPDAGELYRSVSKILNVDPATGRGDWPEPMLSHVAGEGDGKLVVVEVWESKELQEQFMQSHLLPAFQEANVPPPARAEWFSHVGEMKR